MKLLARNIQHGGGTRLARIVEELAAYDADVIALTEYRVGPGKLLCSAMRERGWPYAEMTDPAGKENGIVVFSRVPMLRWRPCPAAPEHRVRYRTLQIVDQADYVATSYP